MAIKPNASELKKLFKQAAEIAQNVPESMQEAAFNRAIDLLTQGIPEHRQSRGTEAKSKPRKDKPASEKEKSSAG